MKTIIMSIIVSLIMVLTPYSITYSNTTAEVTLEWDRNPDADYYVVYFGPLHNYFTHNTVNIPQPAEGTHVTYTVKDLSKCNDWYFSVKAFNVFGNSSDFSDETMVAVKPVPKVNNFKISK